MGDIGCSKHPIVLSAQYFFKSGGKKELYNKFEIMTKTIQETELSIEVIIKQLSPKMHHHEKTETKRKF